MFNELILDKLKEIKSEETCVSRANLFVIKMLLRQERITDSTEQMHIIGNFNDDYFFSQFKRNKNNDFSQFVISNKKANVGWGDNDFCFYFQILLGDNEVLSNKHKDDIVKATIEYKLGDQKQEVLLYKGDSIEIKQLRQITKKDFENVIVIFDQNEHEVLLFTLNEKWKPTGNISLTQQIISDLINKFGRHSHVKSLTRYLEYTHLKKDVIEEWFYSFFTEEDIAYLKDNYGTEKTKGHPFYKLMSFLNFNFLSFEEINNLYKSDVNAYNDYIKESEKVGSYYHSDFESLRVALNDALPFKDIFSDVVKQAIIKQQTNKENIIRNVSFVDFGYILSPKF